MDANDLAAEIKEPIDAVATLEGQQETTLLNDLPTIHPHSLSPANFPQSDYHRNVGNH